MIQVSLPPLISGILPTEFTDVSIVVPIDKTKFDLFISNGETYLNSINDDLAGIPTSIYNVFKDIANAQAASLGLSNEFDTLLTVLNIIGIVVGCIGIVAAYTSNTFSSLASIFSTIGVVFAIFSLVVGLIANNDGSFFEAVGSLALSFISIGFSLASYNFAIKDPNNFKTNAILSIIYSFVVFGITTGGILYNVWQQNYNDIGP